MKYLIICFKIGDLAFASQNTCKDSDLRMIQIGSPHLALKKKKVARRNQNLKIRKTKEIGWESLLGIARFGLQEAAFGSERLPAPTEMQLPAR